MLGQKELEIARSLPVKGCTAAEAQRYTRWLATHHYENFRVVSWLLPSRLHQHFYNVYAYCRWADDLGDEVADPKHAVELLDGWDEELQRAYRGVATHPVLIAVAETARECDIPIEPFRDLLIAFRQDQTVRRYAKWEDVIGYCRYSANPVGRLVLYLMGYRDAERQELSDATCTALQLANFWQDVGRDLEKGRIYIPLELAAARGVTDDDIVSKRFDSDYVELMKELIARTRALFAVGAPLANRVSPEFRVDLDLFSRGGCAVLDAIQSMGYDTLHQRPALDRGVQARLLGRALISRILSSFRSSDDGGQKPENTSLAGRHA
ncbi:MAG TPA: squalene synthase HpnC [Candidatus Acidoferrales bacterium]|nr:squalene synthase HpnC [Candidatus Acidoferrales bacterium]